MENLENVEYCENCGEKLTKDDFTKYDIWIFALGIIISIIGFILSNTVVFCSIGISFNDINIIED